MRRGQRDLRRGRIIVVGRRRRTPTITFDYVIENDAMWATIPSALLTGGGRVGVAPGNYTAKTLSSRNPSSTLTFSATQPGDKPVIDEFTYSGSGNIKFEDIKFVSSSWFDGAESTKGAFTFINTCGSTEFSRCEFVGNYRGVVGAPTYDVTTDDVSELANIVPVFNSSGVVTSLQVINDYVGDLVADGTHSLTFQNTSSITFSVAPVASMTVSGGRITGTTLTSGGASNGSDTTGIGIRSAVILWTGKRQLINWLPRGIRSSSPVTINGPVVLTDCLFDFVTNAFKPSGLAGPVTLVGNRFSRVYMDYFSVGLSGSQSPFAITFTDNFGTLPFSKSGDPGDPHSDWIQMFMDDLPPVVTTSDWENVVFERNIFIDGETRGGVQGGIIQDQPAGLYFSGFRVVGNCLLSSGLANGLNVAATRDGYFYQNLFARYNPLDPANVSAVSFGVGNDASVGGVLMGNNISERVNAYSRPNHITQLYPNVELGLNGATISYSSVFSNHTGPRTTVAEIVAAYAPKVAYSGKGPFADTSYINHVSRVTDRTKEPSFVRFASLLNQSTSSTVTSEWARVQGGVNGRSISIVGGRYRIADDRNGTNATAFTSAPSTVDVGKFVQVEVVNSSSGSTTTTATLSIGGYSYVFDSTTASASSFSKIANGGTAWSLSGAFASGVTFRRCLIACRYNIVSYSSGTRRVSSLPYCGVATGPTARFQLSSLSTRVNANTGVNPVGTMRTYFYSIDLTSQDDTTDGIENSGFVLATDTDGVIYPTTSLFDTRSTAGTGTNWGTASITQANMGWSTGIASFASTAGADISNAEIEFFWMAYGDQNWSIPDVSQASVRNLFTADNIGANGEGPLSATPQIFLTGSAADWNAGLANKGSLSLTLTKQAGTYV